MGHNDELISELEEHAATTLAPTAKDLMERAAEALGADPMSIPREAIDGLVITLAGPPGEERLEYRVLAFDGKKMATVEVECGRCAEKDARIAELEAQISPEP